jgi:hypothetical protein
MVLLAQPKNTLVQVVVEFKVPKDADKNLVSLEIASLKRAITEMDLDQAIAFTIEYI